MFSRHGVLFGKRCGTVKVLLAASVFGLVVAPASALAQDGSADPCEFSGEGDGLEVIRQYNLCLGGPGADNENFVPGDNDVILDSLQPPADPEESGSDSEITGADVVPGDASQGQASVAVEAGSYTESGADPISGANGVQPTGSGSSEVATASSGASSAATGIEDSTVSGVYEEVQEGGSMATASGLTVLPDTGGYGVLVVAGAVLVASGLLVRMVLPRSPR